MTRESFRQATPEEELQIKWPEYRRGRRTKQECPDEETQRQYDILSKGGTIIFTVTGKDAVVRGSRTGTELRNRLQRFYRIEDLQGFVFRRNLDTNNPEESSVTVVVRFPPKEDK